jgi:hypothetical protein
MSSIVDVYVVIHECDDFAYDNVQACCEVDFDVCECLNEDMVLLIYNRITGVYLNQVTDANMTNSASLDGKRR